MSAKSAESVDDNRFKARLYWDVVDGKTQGFIVMPTAAVLHEKYPKYLPSDNANEF